MSELEQQAPDPEKCSYCGFPWAECVCEDPSEEEENERCENCGDLLIECECTEEELEEEDTEEDDTLS